MSVDYCQPAKKGREIFGGLVPFGEVWRTGANEATEIEWDRDVVFGGEAVAKGRYALFTIPGPTEWTVILNSELGQWGAFDHDAARDVVRVTVPVRNVDQMIELFTIHFDGPGAEGEVALTLSWDDAEVAVPILPG